MIVDSQLYIIIYDIPSVLLRVSLRRARRNAAARRPMNYRSCYTIVYYNYTIIILYYTTLYYTILD